MVGEILKNEVPAPPFSSPHHLGLYNWIITLQSYAKHIWQVSSYFMKLFFLIHRIIYPQNRDGNPMINPCGKYMVKLRINGVKRKVRVWLVQLSLIIEVWFGWTAISPICTKKNTRQLQYDITVWCGMVCTTSLSS